RAVVANDNQIKLVRIPRDRISRSTYGEGTTDLQPPVADSRPILPRPPGGVDTAVVANDKQIKLVRITRDRTDRSPHWEDTTDVQHRKTVAQANRPQPPGGEDTAVVTKDQEIKQ